MSATSRARRRRRRASPTAPMASGSGGEVDGGGRRRGSRRREPVCSAVTNRQPAHLSHGDLGQRRGCRSSGGSAPPAAARGRAPGRPIRWPSSRTSGSALATMACDPLGAVRRVRVLVQVAQVRRGRRRRPWRGCGAAAAGRTSGTPRRGPGRDTAGKRTWVAATRCSRAEPDALAQRLDAAARSASHWRSSVRRRPRRRRTSAAGPGRSGRPRPPAPACGPGRRRRSGPSTCVQPLAWKLSGSAGPLDVEALQVGVEVLARAVHRAVRLDLARRPAGCGSARPGRRTRCSSSTSPASGRPPQLGARGQVVRQHPRSSLRVDVEAEQQAAQVLQAARDPLGRGHVRPARRGRSSSTASAGRRPPPRRRRRRAAPGAAAARRSPPGCRPTPRTPARRARNGARSTVSIFMLSSTSTGAPASTSSPTCSGVATTSAGAGERRTPPSSRLTRCVTPSTSTRWIGPCVVGDQPEAVAVDDDLAGVLVEPLELDVRPVHVTAAGDADAEPVRPDPGDAAPGSRRRAA